jgi:suppressor of ftsI
MLAMPGQVLHYSVAIPHDHPPGFFWYQTHPHGESHRQVLDGVSGAIVIEGMERYAPEMGRLRERVLVLRGRSIEHDTNAAEPRGHAEIPSEGTSRQGNVGISLSSAEPRGQRNDAKVLFK